MSGPRFYIITNDSARAHRMFWCHAGNLPRSIAIIDDPLSFERVPDGAQYRCFWWGGRDTVWAWKSVWAARTEAGGITGIDEGDWNKLLDWVEAERRRPTLMLNSGERFDDAPAEALPAAPPLDRFLTEPVVAPAQTLPDRPAKRQSRWL